MSAFTAGKILSWDNLLHALKRPRQAGKTIVFTNGCFDLLHPGHVASLERAKNLGDILVVGLNSDGSVRRLKGPPRPILPLRARAELLAALECVDYVTAFHEDTPLELVKAVRPDILVKGADYAADEIVGAEFAKKVVRIPLKAGYSTSALIAKIRGKRGTERLKD